jgi:hypothetical protein
MNNYNSAALDKYITGNYGEDQFPDEVPRLRCKKCGCFLDDKADKVEDWEDWNTDIDGKKYLLMAGTTEFRTCKRCYNVDKNHIC